MSKNATPTPHTITRPGDLWTVGRHRLVCAKADDTKAIARLMAGVSGPTIVDPPWPLANTVIASDILGAHCYAVVADAQAIDTAIERWQTFTGQQATHADTGLAFDDTPS